MNKTERDGLVQYIDQVGGPVPSRINELTGMLGDAIGRVGDPVLRDELTRIHAALNDANLKIGDKLGETKGLLNQLRMKVLAFKVDDDAPTGGLDPVTPAGPPAGPIAVTPSGTDLPPLEPDGRNRTFLATPGTIYNATLAGPADRLGVSGDNGAIMWGDPTTNNRVGRYNNAASNNGAFKAGDKLSMGIPADRAPTYLIYSAMKYGG